MITDIVSRTDCPASPRDAWQALLRAARYDATDRRCRLTHADLTVQSLSPGVGLRGKARWGEVTYRVTVYVVPLGRTTRLLVVAAIDLGTSRPRLAQRLSSRRLATRDLRQWMQETEVECGDTELRQTA